MSLLAGVRFSTAVLLAWLLAALLPDWIDLHPEAISLPRLLQGPGVDAWLGYDDLGRSVAERLLAGARTSLLAALGVVAVSALFGTLVGALSGYLGGIVDTVTARIIDVFLAFPGILLAIALAGILGPGIGNVVIALSLVGWVGYARLARAQVMALKRRDHITAAISLGSGTGYVVTRHLLPLIAAPLVVEATFGVAAVVIGEAGLSFLGLGVQAPQASWGSMIRDGARFLLVAPHLVLAPGVALMLVVLAVNRLGDRLRDVMDVRRWERADAKMEWENG